MSSGVIRSFIAVDLDDTVREAIAGFQRTLTATGADLKLVETQNIHITLSFLGDVVVGAIAEICRVVDDVKFRPFEVELKGVGVFPNMSRINVVWIDIVKGSETLRDIFNQLQPGIGRLGLRPDDRGFSPHITVARVRSGRNKDRLSKIVLDTQDSEFGKMIVEAVRLKRSVLTPEGPIYSTLHEVSATKT